MNGSFQPDYRHVVDAACNREAERLPLCEHRFDVTVIAKTTGEAVNQPLRGSYAEKVEARRRLVGFLGGVAAPEGF